MVRKMCGLKFKFKTAISKSVGDVFEHFAGYAEFSCVAQNDKVRDCIGGSPKIDRKVNLERYGGRLFEGVAV